MTFKQNLGRYFLVMMFLFAGTYKMIHPGSYQISTLGNIVKIGNFIKVNTGYEVPIPAEFLTLNSEYIVYAIGGLQILSSLLILLNYRIGTIFLTFMMIYFSVTTNNPLNYSKREEKIVNTMMVFLNIGVIAALFIFCSKPAKQKID
ncbi:unnamed protein product [Blepharisma stoltei]|uniref:DoxX family protein n=1 Tax=Blepharisma stoltei TaxID=1481888 RepID=A0AAU9JJZ3_9CILI|nr:unnamed protein product [Blepharisma stoltei]